MRLAYPQYLCFMVIIFSLSLPINAAEERLKMSSRMRDIIDAHIVSVKAWVKESKIIKAVKEQNAKDVTLDQIKVIDQAWIDGGQDALAMTLQNNAVGKYLKEKVSAKRLYTEAFICDKHGAIVGLYPRTSDYWQGDEDKFIRSYNQGDGRNYVGPVEYDESTEKIAVQISVPVLDGDDTIGVLVVGIRNFF